MGKRTKEPVASASLGIKKAGEDGWDSSDEELLSQRKKAPTQTCLKSFFGAGAAPAAETTPATAPAARAVVLEPANDSDDSESEADDFNFDIPDQKGKTAPPTSASGDRVSSTDMVPGWRLVVRTTDKGRNYNTFIGPNGETAQSVPDMKKKAGQSVPDGKKKAGQSAPDEKKKKAAAAAGSFGFTAADSSDEGESDFVEPKKGTLEGMWRSKVRDEVAAKAASDKPGDKHGAAPAKAAKAKPGAAAASKAAAKQKLGGTSAGGSSAGATGVKAAGVKAGTDEDDMLAQLLQRRKAREEENRLVTERVTEDVEQFMDNGVRINPELRKMFAPDVGTS